MQPLLTERKDFVEELVIEMQSHLAYFFDKLNLDSLRMVIDHLLSCKGTLF